MKSWIKRSLITLGVATLVVGGLSACGSRGDHSQRWSEERVTEIALPELTGRFRGQLVALQARMKAPSSALPRNSLVLLPQADSMVTPRAWVQASDLLTHARIGPFGGAVWVTSNIGLRESRASRQTMLFRTDAAIQIAPHLVRIAIVRLREHGRRRDQRKHCQPREKFYQVSSHAIRFNWIVVGRSAT